MKQQNESVLLLIVTEITFSQRNYNIVCCGMQQKNKPEEEKQDNRKASGRKKTREGPEVSGSFRTETTSYPYFV
jgi:hypothetical protein